ncbi:MAG: DNA primase [Planctomycetota bacterium]
MSFGSSLDAKEQVREALDIVDLVGKYVQLRRQGRHYVALCPWHDDTRPSLQVNPERQSFKCWVCDIGGDIFSFVMQMEGVSFPEALAMLAEQAGVTLRPQRSARKHSDADSYPDEDQAAAADVESSGETKRALFRAMGWAEKQYHDCLLNAPEAEPAREYLRQRGITPESTHKFHLGFSPNRPDWIWQQAGGTPARAKVLETIGVLARSSADGSLYDRFRGRLLFSIRDPQDRPIGFGGRVLPESGVTSRAKYVNSPETPLFTKSGHLYGLDVARSALRKGRVALCVEGYTDCIVAHQHGFEHTVAVLGTALGERHVRILKRFADRIVLVLDGDEAGRRRANEVLELFVAENVDLQIATLPDHPPRGGRSCRLPGGPRTGGLRRSLGHPSGRRPGPRLPYRDRGR